MIHLERSGNAPLSIHLTVANTDLVMQAIVGQVVNAPVELRAWCMLIKTLFNHSDRIHRLAFVLGGISGDDPSAAFILSTFRHSFTSLRHLSLSTPQSPHEVLDLSIFPIHSFTLHQPCRSDNFFRWHTLPLSQITELGLLDVTPQVLLMFLPRFPNLMVAKLRICYSHSPHSDLSRATRLLLPHLHTLEIRYIDEWESDDLFLALEILVLPALTHFSLIVKEDSSVCMFVQQRSVYPAMQHLLEHVRVLRMTRVPFDICHIPQLLAKLRSVAELAITQLQVGSIPAAASISTVVLKELSKEGIVPQLRSLTIVVPKEPEDGLLEKMRESRSDVLRSVDIKVQMDDKYRLGMMVVQNMAEEFVP
ncbi:hypothetical protein VNI00_012962 [Paramarasmius palmivorus]|uniref:F-box domain-containing protein n=1 Tax=Paramarasmius palmivorus TaxID=297713 RepID=A0AAW0C3N2_9AGAR